MPKFRNFQTNFSGGLLSEGMLGRVDLAQYENGCRQLENWWPKVTGGMRRRPGSVYLNTPPSAIRIESFIFSETQVYIFVFCSDSRLRIYNEDTGALILNLAIGVVTLTATNIPEMSITQTADVMFCAHESFQTFMIRRTGASTFTDELFEFESINPATTTYPKTMPFVKYADSETSINVTNHINGASVTVTCSDPVFHPYHVGTAIRYRTKQMLVTAVPTGPYPVVSCTATIKEELDRGCLLNFDMTVSEPKDFIVGEIVIGRTTGTKGEVLETLTSTIKVALVAGFWGSGAPTEEIEGADSGNIGKLTAKVLVAPYSSADWDEEAFTDTNGHPAVIEFHSQRLWLSGSSSLPAHIFGSRVAAFFNFDLGDAFPADSIQVVIADKTINKVQDIVSGRHMQVFTDAGEFYVPQSEELPLQPDTFDIRKQTRYGSKSYVEPIVFDESTIFLQSQGNAVREFIWVDSQRGYSSDAISLISEEFINDIQEIEVLYGGYDRPEQIAFFVNGDGNITWFHAARSEGIRTWGIWTTNGSYKSLTVLNDKLYALVERTADGFTSIMLERFELYLTVDSAVTKVSSGLALVSGFAGHLPHLPITLVDLVVAVDADGAGDLGGAGLPDQALDADYYAGSITTSPSGATSFTAALAIGDVTNLTAGLSYKQTLEIMPIEVKDSNGVTGGMPKRIVSADVYLASTLAISIEGNRVLTFQTPSDFSLRPAAITGVRKFYLLGYSERPTLLVENEVPVPCELLSISAEVEY